MGQTLTNGIYLPAEGERNCYTGLAANWTALDSLIGGYNAHIGNATIHVTAEDKAAWNGKAEASALTAHTGDATIHVTAEDKAKWDTVTGKANDADVVHKSGDETVGGNKTFSSVISNDGSYLGNESSQNERTCLCLRSNRDTADKSGAYISRFRANKNQGELLSSDNSFISISFMENETRYTRCFDFGLTDWDADGIPQTYYLTSPGSKGVLGTSSRKWQAINGLNPSSLSMPDLDNGIDISSYLDTSKSSRNYYTPPVNGWISIKGRSNSNSGIAIIQNGMAQMGYTLIDFGSSDRITFCALPVKGGVQVEIWLKSVTTLDSAKFFSCLGNV